MKTSNDLNVLMLSIGYGGFGGVELGAERLRDWLVKHNIGVMVVASGKSNDIYKVPTLGFWRIFWPIFAYLKSVYIITFKKVDVIYARYALYPMFLGIILKLISGKPLVVSIHGGDIRHGFPLRYFISWGLRRADRVICYDNPGHIKEIKKRGVDPIVIPNGIDTRFFKPSKLKSKIKKVIYVGGTRSIKGWIDIIGLSCRRRLDRLDDLKFYIYATASMPKSINTVFSNRVEHSEMKNVLESRQLFILPSYAEGVPGSLLEAMARGMYVIASDLDFTRTIFPEKFLFKAGDINRMEELVMEFYNNKESYFGDQNIKNRKIVVDNYSMDMSGEKWKELFLSLKK